MEREIESIYYWNDNMGADIEEILDKKGQVTWEDFTQVLIKYSVKENKENGRIGKETR